MFNSEQTFTINGDDYNDLEKIIKLALEIDNSTVEAFYKDKKGLVFCSYECSGSEKYPFKASATMIVEHIRQYLGDLSENEIFDLAGVAPDNDGSVELGWEVFHPLWYGENKIEKYEWCAFIAVRPCWIVYGK